MNQEKIPDLKDRIQAMMIDIVIIFGLSFIAYKVFDNIEIVSSDMRMWTFIFIFWLYDPLLTSFIGGTLGHRALNLRVRRSSNKSKNILLPLAILRFSVKAFLGIISLITVSVNSKGNAIHDLISGSVVVYKKQKMSSNEALGK